MDRLNSFAVVSYLTGPTADFVDALRQQFTPDCPHHAHITVLPPRPLSVGYEEAIADCNSILKDVEPFEMIPGSVELFESTQVIKLSFRSGVPRLKDLHDRLNASKMAGPEVFEFVPHITLGQDIPRENVGTCLEIARQQWDLFRPGPPIVVENLTCVQQIVDGCWLDLASMELGNGEPVGVGKSSGARRIPQL